MSRTSKRLMALSLIAVLAASLLILYLFVLSGFDEAPPQKGNSGQVSMRMDTEARLGVGAEPADSADTVAEYNGGRDASGSITGSTGARGGTEEIPGAVPEGTRAEPGVNEDPGARAPEEEPLPGVQPPAPDEVGVPEPTPVNPGAPEETPAEEPTDGEPSPSGQELSLEGEWSLDLLGSLYQIADIPLILEEDGSVGVGAAYDDFLTLREGHYDFDPGNNGFGLSFECEMDLGLAIGPIPVVIEMRGTADSSLTAIEGNFTATPEGEFSWFVEEGPFRMDRQ